MLRMLKFVAIIIVGVIAVVIAYNIIFNPYVVKGNSMFPTISDGDYVITNEFTNNYERGDIIIFKNPFADRVEISRIVGLPGEEISIKAGEVYINNVLFVEEYAVADNIPRGLPNFTLPAKNYFVMGDNRPNSTDSRHWGPLSQDYIISKFIRVLIH